MPYTGVWDESAPQGTVDASTLDTEIQAFKIGVRERIEQVIPSWSDESEDPKKVVAHSGLEADKPDAADAYEGQLYMATDSGILSVFDGAAWVQTSGSMVVGRFDGGDTLGQQLDLEGRSRFVIAGQMLGATTNASGDIILDLSEFSIIDVKNIYLMSKIFSIESPLTAAKAIVVGGTASTLTVRILDYTGSAMTSQIGVTFSFILVYVETFV